MTPVYLLLSVELFSVDAEDVLEVDVLTVVLPALDWLAVLPCENFVTELVVKMLECCCAGDCCC